MCAIKKCLICLPIPVVSVAALQGGADEVVNMDMSKGALGIGQTESFAEWLFSAEHVLGHDIFKSWAN